MSSYGPDFSSFRIISCDSSIRCSKANWSFNMNEALSHSSVDCWTTWERGSLALFEGLLCAFLNGPDDSWGEGFPYCCGQLFQKMVVLHPEIMKQIEGYLDFCTYPLDCFFPTMTGYKSSCTVFVPIADSSIECAVLDQACLYS